MIRYFAAHPTAANLLMLLLLVLGVAAAPTLKRETFPEIPANEIEVAVVYPGASAEEVEEAICRRLEDALDGVTDLDELRCEAREGRATATVVKAERGDFDRLQGDVKTEVDAIADFPPEAEAPTVRQLGLSDFVVAVAVTGPMGVADLKAYAERLKDRLQLDVPEISRVDLRGFSDHQIRIEIPARTLRQYGLSLADIATTIGRQSLDLPAGAIKSRERDILLRFQDVRRSVREFEDLIVVAGRGGAEVRLGDIAEISDRFEADEDKIIFNGARAALLEIQKGRADDTLNVIAAVKDVLDDERRRAPPGVSFTLTRDIASIVRDRLDLLLSNGGQGLVLVLLTLTAFFALRYSIWVALGLPVSFAGALFAMALIGYSIDMITMVGLLIAVGILVDDAIVIAENIAAERARGKEPLAAAIDGARGVAPGVIASFATTLIVFAPLAFLRGEIGSILRVMPVVLILTLSVSLIEAFCILPSHLRHGLAMVAKRPPSRLRRRFDAALEAVREGVAGRIADFAVNWRYLCAGLSLFVFFASVAMLAGGTLKFRVFPDLDGDVAEARILLPQGTPLARTEEVVALIVAALERVDRDYTPRQPGGQPLVRNTSVRFSRNLDAFETGPHVATVTADLLTAESRIGRVDDILAAWRREVGAVPDVISIKFAELVPGPGGLPIDIRLQDESLAVLQVAARELKGWLGGYRGVHDLSDDLRPGKPEIRLSLREGALALGLDAGTIAAQMRAAFFGHTADEVQVGPEAYEIDVRLAAEDRDSLADLEDFTITAPDGAQVPLGAVATLERARGYARIHRVDGLRTVTIQGEVDANVANAGEILADTRSRFLPDLQARYPGLRVNFEGQEREGSTTAASVRRGFLLGLIGVYLVLSFMFRSYIEPVVAMATIPMGLVGVIWGHLAMGLDLTMPSIIGFVALAGVVVNNSILLVEFAKRHIAAGRSVADAARLASRERFRAILLTSLTTVAGLLPLLTETSLQAQVLVPLVTSLTFGIIAGTFTVLFVVPALYTILDDFGLLAVGVRPAEAS